MGTLLRSLLTLLILGSPLVYAATSSEIDSQVADVLKKFRIQSPSGAELIDKAEGVLVFPNVTKLGFGVGGEFGEGALLVDGETAEYYTTTSASFGLQLGLQFKAQIILFMNEGSLRRFRRSDGWKVGVDGSVALAKLGAGGAIDSETAKQPIIGFVFSNKGLMYNLTLEGSKITVLER